LFIIKFAYNISGGIPATSEHGPEEDGLPVEAVLMYIL